MSRLILLKLSTFALLSLIIFDSVLGFKPVLQNTVEAIFNDRSKTVYPGACKVLNSTSRQIKICRKDPGLEIVLANARTQAIDACEQNFQYDRWNCSLIYNGKAKKSVFKNIYRETAFIHALVAASLTHAVAKGCASGDLYRCSCLRRNITHWKGAGCGDDFKYGKRLIRNFLGLKETGNDQLANILKQNALVGINSIKQHLKEVCKCHGFSGSCTTKTCWKRLVPFNSVMGLLKKHYHHAVRKKIVNATIHKQSKSKNQLDVDKLVYIQRTPNLCVSTKGRICKDRNNCATLCCGRGFNSSKKSVRNKCRCKMPKCCLVICDTCVEEVDVFTCK